MDSDKSEIQTALEKHDLKIKIDYVTVPSDEDWGTGQSLRHIHDRIYTDVLIVSCDLITDAQLHGAFDLFRKHDASVVSMVFDNGPQEYIQVPGPKSKDKQERDLIGIDEETKRLVFQASASDFDESVELSQYFLRKHPVLKISSRLLDAHVYIFKKWIVNFLKENDFTTIKGELLPFIIKKQLSKPPVDDKNTSVAHYKVSNDVFKFATLKHFDDMIRKKSTYNDHKTGTKNCYNNDIIKCYTYVAPANSYGIRVNTLSSYCLANSKVSKYEIPQSLLTYIYIFLFF